MSKTIITLVKTDEKIRNAVGSDWIYPENKQKIYDFFFGGRKPNTILLNRGRDGYIFEFPNKGEAMLFKLTYGGNE